jgi:hypothetical protein
VAVAVTGRCHRSRGSSPWRPSTLHRSQASLSSISAGVQWHGCASMNSAARRRIVWMSSVSLSGGLNSSTAVSSMSRSCCSYSPRSRCAAPRAANPRSPLLCHGCVGVLFILITSFLILRRYPAQRHNKYNNQQVNRCANYINHFIIGKQTPSLDISISFLATAFTIA